MYANYKEQEKQNKQSGHVTTVSGASQGANRSKSPQAIALAQPPEDALIAGDGAILEETVCELNHSPGNEEDVSMTVVITETPADVFHDDAEETHSEPINVDEEPLKAVNEDEGDHPETKEPDKSQCLSEDDGHDKRSLDAEADLPQEPDDVNKKDDSDAEEKNDSVDGTARAEASVEEVDAEQTTEKELESNGVSDPANHEKATDESQEIVDDSASPEEVDQTSCSSKTDDEVTAKETINITAEENAESRDTVADEHAESCGTIDENNDKVEEKKFQGDDANEVNDEKPDDVANKLPENDDHKEETLTAATCETTEEEDQKNEGNKEPEAEVDQDIKQEDNLDDENIKNTAEASVKDDNKDDNIDVEPTPQEAEAAVEIKAKPDQNPDEISAEVGDHVTTDDKNHVIPTKPEDGKVRRNAYCCG